MRTLPANRSIELDYQVLLGLVRNGEARPAEVFTFGKLQPSRSWLRRQARTPTCFYKENWTTGYWPQEATGQDRGRIAGGDYLTTPPKCLDHCPRTWISRAITMTSPILATPP
jgi:hypothetical protein